MRVSWSCFTSQNDIPEPRVFRWQGVAEAKNVACLSRVPHRTHLTFFPKRVNTHTNTFMHVPIHTILNGIPNVALDAVQVSETPESWKDLLSHDQRVHQPPLGKHKCGCSCERQANPVDPRPWGGWSSLC